ncbi:Heterokaryon incompatibility 6 OR allele protein [Rutstroemia sp. NJR-2017a BVV2]|nr:Heterokaryon incompatibility 6 OR allele protein [Rutstroemia sp. NJR-2017a BVV2]
MGLLDRKKGSAKADAMTDIIGEPRKYMKIELCERDPADNKFRFEFKGCNCGRKVKTGVFSSKPILSYDQPITVVGDETGRALVQCATILGSIIDPGHKVVEYRRRLLKKLQPSWKFTDPLAKPMGWEDKCVSGTYWEHLIDFRVHNTSVNYIMESVSCGSRLENESTSKILCKLEVNCGCKIIGSFPLVFQALTAVEGSSLGKKSVKYDKDGRIIWQDGLGLVQVGDVGKIFHLVAYGGDISAYKSYASRCRRTDLHKRIIAKPVWPKSRVMVGEEFTHGIGNFMRNYGYVNTGGSGNLLICRNQPLDKYKVIGVCMDQKMEVKKGSTKEKYVTIQ